MQLECAEKDLIEPITLARESQRVVNDNGKIIRAIYFRRYLQCLLQRRTPQSEV